jgi:hypothetical protein
MTGKAAGNFQNAVTGTKHAVRGTQAGIVSGA